MPLFSRKSISEHAFWFLFVKAVGCCKSRMYFIGFVDNYSLMHLQSALRIQVKIDLYKKGVFMFIVASGLIMDRRIRVQI